MRLSEGLLSTYNTELTFIGRYGTMVHMCLEPKISGGELTVGQSVTGDSPAVVLTYASALKEKHWALHKAAGTELCSVVVDNVSAIFRNRANLTVWKP